MPAPARIPGCFLLAWMLVWTIVVSVFDGAQVWALAHQARALTFPAADGVVTRSAIKTTHGDGESHRLDVTYDYTVAGRRYTGTRYSYSEMGTNTKAWHTVRDELPVGAAVPVYYDPDDPAESVLRPGLTGMQVWMVWFLTPFNVIAIGGWVYYFRRNRPAFDPADARSVAPTATGWRVRLPSAGPAGCFGAVLLAVTFCGTFVWGIGFGMNPPVPLAGWAYVATVAVAAALAALGATPVLEVDEVTRVVRVRGAEVAFAAVRAVTVVHEEQKRDDGPDSHSYHCELVRDGAPPVRAATYSEPGPAEALAAWLRARIGTAPG